MLAIEDPAGSQARLHKIDARLEPDLASKLPNHPSIPKAVDTINGKVLFSSRQKSKIPSSEFGKISHTNKLAVVVDILTCLQMLYASGLGLTKIEPGFAVPSLSDRQYELSSDTCMCIWPSQVLWVLDGQLGNIVPRDQALTDWRCAHEALRLCHKLMGLKLHEEMATCIETKSILDVIKYFKIRHAGSDVGHSSSTSVPLSVGHDV